MEEKWLSNLLLDSLMTPFQFKKFCSFETGAKIVINGEKWTYSRLFQNTKQAFDSIDLGNTQPISIQAVTWLRYQKCTW